MRDKNKCVNNNIQRKLQEKVIATTPSKRVKLPSIQSSLHEKYHFVLFYFSIKRKLQRKASIVTLTKIIKLSGIQIFVRQNIKPNLKWLLSAIASITKFALQKICLNGISSRKLVREWILCKIISFVDYKKRKQINKKN